MAKQTINIGSVAGDGTGDPLRTAMDKANQNFTELYANVASAQSDIDAAQTDIIGKISNDQKGVANGVATLDIDGLIPVAQLPDLTKADVGLSAVDNTSDADKPISTATQTALNAKQALDATLTALAALNSSAGVIEQTGADTFVKRAIGTGAGQLLTTDDADGRYAAGTHDHDLDYAPKQQVIIETTTARSLLITDAGAFIRCTNAGATTITLPLDATQAIPVGTTILIQQAGAGLVSFAADGAAVIEKLAAKSLASLGTGAVVRAVKVAANTWSLSGDLA